MPYNRIESKTLLKRKFGKLRAVSIVGKTKSKHVLIRCQCDCGNYFTTRKDSLLAGNTKSCGCLLPHHGLSSTSSYKVWEGMKQRCLNKNNRDYKNYGGRGITVCKRWLKFINFYEDMGERPAELTLERINNNKGYSPNNCKWATRTEQLRNTRKHKDNKSGVKGVFWDNNRGKYVAKICVDYKQIHLGVSLDIDKAAILRKNGEKKYFKESR